MAKFFGCTNNGVLAVVREDVMDQIKKWKALPDIQRAATPYPLPIFTFTKNPSFFHTGDYNLLDRLMEGDWTRDASFYVPFSNSYEWRGIEKAFQEQPIEWRFKTTLAQAVETFELWPPPYNVLLDASQREGQK